MLAKLSTPQTSCELCANRNDSTRVPQLSSTCVAISYRSTPEAAAEAAAEDVTADLCNSWLHGCMWGHMLTDSLSQHDRPNQGLVWVQAWSAT